MSEPTRSDTQAIRRVQARSRQTCTLPPTQEVPFVQRSVGLLEKTVAVERGDIKRGASGAGGNASPRIPDSDHEAASGASRVAPSIPWPAVPPVLLLHPASTPPSASITPPRAASNERCGRSPASLAPHGFMQG